MEMEANPTLTDEQKKELLERQFQTAMAGSEALQIHLGKTYLGQHDRTHHTVEAVPYEGLTHEELLDRLAERQRELPDEKLQNELASMFAARKGVPAALTPHAQDDSLLVIHPSKRPRRKIKP